MASIYFKTDFHGFAEVHDPQDDSVSYDEISLVEGESIDLFPGDKIVESKDGIFLFFSDGAVLSLSKGVYEIRG